MANPLIPGITATEQDLLYQKLNAYNRQKTSFKEVGAYLVVLPRTDHPRYSLWIYSPLPEKQSIFYIFDLDEDVHEALRISSTLCYYSSRPLFLVEYNAKRMQNRGDDIISFGKYHGHYLHEILQVDPGYLTWIAFKFTPRIPKQERFAQIARIYHSVYIDILQRKAQQPSIGRYLGKEGEKVENLVLTIFSVRLEDDPYKTQVKGTIPYFYVRQNTETERRLRKSCNFPHQLSYGKPGSCQLPAMEHAYRIDETVHIASAHIANTYTIGKNKWNTT